MAEPTRFTQQLLEQARALIDLDVSTAITLDIDPVRLLFSLVAGSGYEVPADRRVVALQRAGRASRVDRGVHSLHLGLGTLAWRDAAGSLRLAPLWLLPVDLEGNRVVLAAPPVFNHALADALDRDHGLVLDHSLDLAALLDAAAGAALTRDGWRVDRNAVLAALPVAEAALARDVARLDGYKPFAPSPELPASAVEVPLDADADQLAVIAASGTGGSFVVDAPPGTGATQVIANAIVHNASLGHSVLVVSDRLAALDAIGKRLATVGLDELAVSLHGDVIGQLARVLDRPFRPGSGPAGGDTRLAELRATLDGHARALHAIGPFGRSLHDVLGRLVELRTSPRAELADADASALDRARYERRLAAVTELAAAAVPVEPVATHPWKRSTLRDCRDTSRVAKALAEADHAATELAGAIAEFATLVPGITAKTPAQLEALGALADIAAASPRPGAELVAQVRAKTDDLGESIARIRARGGGVLETPRDPATFVAVAARHRALAREVDDRFTDAVEHLDAAQLWSQLKRWTGRMAPLRFVALRAARAEVAAAAMPDGFATDEAIVDGLEAVLAERACRHALAAAAEPAKRWFGELCTDPLTIDLSKVDAAVAWASELRRAFDQVTIPFGDTGRQHAWRALVAQVSAGASSAVDDLAAFRRLADAVARWTPALVELAAATGIADPGAGDDHLAALREQLAGLTASGVDALAEWARFHAARVASREAGIGPALAAIERGDLGAADLASAWERATLLAWADAEHVSTPALASFHGPSHHAHVAAFADLDRGSLALARARALARVAERIPRVPRTWAPPTGDAVPDPLIAEGALLLAEAKLERKRPLRDILAAMPALLPRLAPAILATPAAVAQHLDPALRFDLVIIDDAGSLPTAHALGALSRASAAIVIGDPRALPPPRDTGVLVDAIAAGLPVRLLRTCYRMRHEDLFAVANARMYANRVQVLPAPHASPELGLAWRHGDVAVAAADVIARLRDPAQRARSLAVIALTRTHANAIEDAIDAARAADQSVDAALCAESAEPLVVRAVDQAHGLVRDVVVFYAGTPDIPPAHLAVALTRAREQLVIATPFVFDDASDAPLAATIEVARGIRQKKDGEPASPITDAIARALAERGWTVRHAVGVGPYRLDLAVVDPSDPSDPDRFVLAIEHDGTAYAGATAARDRDRLRPHGLAQLGWRLHRIWSIDWWLDPEREIQRAHGAIVAAIAASRQRRAPVAARQPRATRPPTGSGPVKPRQVAVGSGPATLAIPSELAGAAPTTPVKVARGAISIGPYTAAAIPAGRRMPDDMFAPRHLPELGKVIEQVLAAEAPIHIDLLARRVGAYFGIGRVTQRVTDQVRVALAGRGRWGDEQGVVWRLDQDPAAVPPVRVAGNAAEGRRDIGEVPLTELAAAARVVVERATLAHKNVTTSDLVRDSARLLGFTRLTDKVVERVACGVRLAAIREMIAIDNDRASMRD